MSREHKIFAKLNSRYAFSLFIILNMSYLLALGSALHSYKGICTGFLSDHSYPCEFGMYVSNELVPAFFLNMIPVLICSSIWGGVVGNYWRLKLRRRRIKYAIFNFLPFGGGIIGLIIGFFIWLIYPQVLYLIITT
jgi:hypothetical protein